jgi:hypothetical protein
MDPSDRLIEGMNNSTLSLGNFDISEEKPRRFFKKNRLSWVAMLEVVLIRNTVTIRLLFRMQCRLPQIPDGQEDT